MFQQKEAERYNTGQLMQLAQNKSPAQTDRQVRTPSPLRSNFEAKGLRSGEFEKWFLRTLKLY
jgi:hypothetical protein